MGRKTIWMNPPLEDLAKKSEGKGRDGQFSRRLGDIVERYGALIKLTPVPELTDSEKMILGVLGANADPTSIRYMGDRVIDTGAAPLAELKALAQKVNSWTVAEKIAVIESFGL